ncbi:hypothetical protein BC350_06075 [Ralstonia pseudosolanacearum]|nr:hypothetical protein BC350_06075 [Ralstonia pseudosolanacearum]
MPQEVAVDLYRLGLSCETNSAGTYVRQVFAQLLIDFAWNSSRLEGNRYSVEAAEDLLNGGAIRCDVDTVMLLNHKAAVEFFVECVPREGLSSMVVRNLHALLMQDLLPDSGMLGAIRENPVGIAGTLYAPMHERDLLVQMLDSIVAKAGFIRNPVEAALFLWVNLAYLQPFEDGNECTSRLAANIPLLFHNCAPLSFQDVARHDFERAMLGVYEFQDVTLAADLFSWSYRRSATKYRASTKSAGKA